MLTIIVVFSLVGVILNLYKRREGFLLWMVTNGFWTIHNFKIGEWEQAVLFLTYFLLAIWGFLKWRPEEKKFIWPRDEWSSCNSNQKWTASHV